MNTLDVSATVAEMRSSDKILDKHMIARWADALEAAERRIKSLEEESGQFEALALEATKMVVKLEAQLEAAERDFEREHRRAQKITEYSLELESQLVQQAKPVDWEAMGKIVREAYYGHAWAAERYPWEQEPDVVRDDWKEATKAAIAAYQASQSEGGSDGD